MLELSLNGDTSNIMNRRRQLIVMAIQSMDLGLHWVLLIHNNVNDYVRIAPITVMLFLREHLAGLAVASAGYPVAD